MGVPVNGPPHHRWSEAERHIAAVDPHMASLMARNGPCRLRPDDNVFVGILEAIVSQQLSGKAAATIFGRFQALFPDGITPEALCDTPVETLRATGLSGAKARYCRSLAQHVLDGSLELERLDGLDDEDVITELTAVKGIGRWTAEMILIFHLNRPDVLPLDDLGIREGFRRTYTMEERPARDEMLRIAEPWRPWRTVGAWYLWRALDEPPFTGKEKP